jgi:hypothetical protein
MLSAGSEGTSTVEASLSDTSSGVVKEVLPGCCGTSYAREQIPRKKGSSVRPILLQAAIDVPLVLPKGNSRRDISATTGRDQDVVLLGEREETRSDMRVFHLCECAGILGPRDVILATAD